MFRGAPGVGWVAPARGHQAPAHTFGVGGVQLLGIGPPPPMNVRVPGVRLQHAEACNFGGAQNAAVGRVAPVRDSVRRIRLYKEAPSVRPAPRER